MSETDDKIAVLGGWPASEDMPGFIDQLKQVALVDKPDAILIQILHRDHGGETGANLVQWFSWGMASAVEKLGVIECAKARILEDSKP